MALSILVALFAAAAPAFARLSESVWGLAPCALCLWQRWPYWGAAALAALAAALPRVRRPLLSMAGAAVLASAVVAGFHVGVEAGWWPSPLAGCQAAAPLSRDGSIDDLMRSLPAAPGKPCDAPTFLLPGVPLSMAAMNLFYALGLGATVLIFVGKGGTR